MTNWNKEIELCNRWLKYKIDWYANYLIFGTEFRIDVSGIPSGFTAEKIISVYKQQGIMFINADNDLISESKCLTFEEWKNEYNHPYES